MRISKEEACAIIEEMDRHLRTDLLQKAGKVQENKLWENTYIRRQIEKRNRNGRFSLEDHICAMAYSMLSAIGAWDRVPKDIDPDTGRILSVDKVFYNYDAKQLLGHTPEELRDAVKKLGCATPATLNQMKALLSVNIPKLAAMEKESGTIDAYYQKWIEIDNTMKSLITALSAANSKDKLAQMDVALVCEYLRNVGYDIPKPDAHMRRLLGSDYFALSSHATVPELEAFDIIVELAELAGKSAAETDYILWSYCAAEYGEICTTKNPKCEICTASAFCEGNGRKKGHDAEA